MPDVIQDLEAFDKALEETERMEAQHKSAFRKTYEFLKRQYPPRWDEAYWLSAVKDITSTLGSEPDNKLLEELLACVYWHLSDILKAQRESAGIGDMNA